MTAAVWKPALHTFWQSALAALLIWWHGAGVVGFHAVHNVSDAKRFALSVAVAVLAALASALMHTLKLNGPTLLYGVFGDRVDPGLQADMDAAFAGHLSRQLPPPPQE